MTRTVTSESRGTLRLGHAADSQLRWVLADVAELVETARVERDLSPLAAIGFGQMLAAATMLTRLTAKRPMRMLLEAAGDGPLGRVRAEADTLGHLRGLVEHRLAATTDDSGDASELGAGTFRVIRHTDNRNYESKVALVPGGVARNVANFLGISEQVRSAVLLGVQARATGIVAGGGLIVQAMPDADPRVVRSLEDRLETLPGASLLLEEEGADGLLGRALGELGPEPLHEAPLALSCDCDRDRFGAHIRALAETQPDVLDENDDTRVECSFCGARYVFEREELMSTVN